MIFAETSWSSSRLEAGDMMQLHGLNYSSEMSVNDEDDFDDEDDDIDEEEDEEISVT